MPISKQQFDQLGIALYYLTPQQGYTGGWMAIENGIAKKVDPQAGEYLKSIGVPVDERPASQGVPANTSGGNTITLNSLEGSAVQLRVRAETEAEEQRVRDLNRAISEGDSARVRQLSPGYDLIEGSFVQSSPIPNQSQLTQDVFNQTMSSMQNKGLTLNPNANLDDPKTLAEFLRVAEGEVEPYYKSQLKVARDQFLRQQGYTTDDILRTETELEKKYGAQVRELASSAAESGFAQSGRRVMEEKDLAEGTQSLIDKNRRDLAFKAYGQAGEFAQTYGGLLGEKAPQGPQLANAPRVLQGETGFARPGGTSAFYQLSDDVYSNLVGSAEKERVTGIRDLAQQQEEFYRTNQANTRNII